MSALRIGIIGTGFMGGVHAEAWRAIAECSLEAVFVRSGESRVHDLAGSEVAAYTDLHEFFDAVDVVDICVPTHLHAHFALAAAEAGKPTICEKPLALTSADGRNVVDAFARRGLPLLVAHVVRFSPEYSAARSAVRSGAIGELSTVRLATLSFAPDRGAHSWFHDEAKSGGIIFDLMIHNLDYALWLAGMVDTVYARVSSAGPGHAIAILQHESGAISHVEGSWSEPPTVFRTQAELAGADGFIEFSSDTSAPIISRLCAPPGAANTGLIERAGGVNPFETEMRHFIDVIENRATPIVTATDALRAVQLAEAARESAITGRPIRLTQDEKGASRG
ncbi:MAG: Gfo/Idh/MocA family protein [Rhodoglobus sp.]